MLGCKKRFFSYILVSDWKLARYKSCSVDYIRKRYSDIEISIGNSCQSAVFLLSSQLFYTVISLSLPCHLSCFTRSFRLFVQTISVLSLFSVLIFFYCVARQLPCFAGWRFRDDRLLSSVLLYFSKTFRLIFVRYSFIPFASFSSMIWSSCFISLQIFSTWSWV